MRRIVSEICAGVLALTLLTAAEGKRIAPPPSVVQRLALAEAAVVGKVIEIEAKNVTAVAPYPGSTDKVEYQVAVVKIGTALAGVKDVTQIRVGFLPGGRAMLGKDQEVCLFLTRHPVETFYIMPDFYGAIDAKSPNGEKEVELAKRTAKLLADPMAGLKSKDADDRLITASALILRYRMQRPGVTTKQEDVPADESKLILQTLGEADWTKMNPTLGYMATPQQLFLHLGLQPKDGWTQPKDFAKVAAEAKAWLKANAGSYRMQRFVADKKD